MKKVIIAGGTGFIGTYLGQRFEENGYQVLIVSRQNADVQWNKTALAAAFNNAELVINLAGKNINCRHNTVNKKAIIESRVQSAQLIGEAIKDCSTPPKLWINASATGIYKSSFTKAATEEDTDLGNDFLAEVVRNWEKALFNFELPNTRKIALRTSVVLGQNGGALQPLTTLTRLGLGGKQAGGNQIFSWIHQEDYFQIVLFLLNKSNLEGIVNCTSPHPLPNKELMYQLRKALHVPIGLPAPEFIIRLGAKIIGTAPELVLNSSYVLPKRLLDSGYQFQFGKLEDILTKLI